MLAVPQALLVTAAAATRLFSVAVLGAGGVVFEASVSAFSVVSTGNSSLGFTHQGCSIQFPQNEQIECDASVSSWCTANAWFMGTSLGLAWTLVLLDAKNADNELRASVAFFFVVISMLAAGLLTNRAESGAADCGFLPSAGHTTLEAGAYLIWLGSACGVGTLVHRVETIAIPLNARAVAIAGAAVSFAAIALPLGGTANRSVYPWAPVETTHCVPQFERLYTGNKVLSLLIAIGWIIAAWTTHKAVAGVLWLLITILVSWNLWAFDTSAESCGFEGPTSLGVGLLLYSAEWIGLSLAAAFQLALASTAKPLTM